ncbi:MAG: hypothetical protein BGN82_08710 [Alphaproteobacteria bacterium 65-7]|nr:MAG: hypothetical protein BGN82_08710 [Alphaproteobacteria bacterium 65-7]
MDDLRPAVHAPLRRDPAPAKPVPAHVTADMRPDEAFRITLSGCLAQITANAAALKAGRSVEGLHQLRVALRRLDVAIQAFAKEFRQPWLEELRDRGKILSDRVGPARDLDVFVETLLDAVPCGDGMTALRRRAQAARDAAWKTVEACVRGPDLALFLEDVAALAASRLPLGRDHRLPCTAARILDRQWQRVKKRGRAAKGRADPDGADLHRLRIALKKLRYAAEVFAPLYPARKVKAYLKQARALQEHLGDLNDIVHVRQTLALVLRAESRKHADRAHDDDMAFAAGMVAGWYGAHAAEHARQALRCYADFKAVKPFWD